MSFNSAWAVTIIPSGVGAMCLTVIDVATVINPFGNFLLTASIAALSIKETSIGVAKDMGIDFENFSAIFSVLTSIWEVPFNPFSKLKLTISDLLYNNIKSAYNFNASF